MFSKNKNKHVSHRKAGRRSFHIGIILILLGASIFSIGGEVPGFGLIIVGTMVFLDSLLVGRIVRLEPPGHITKGKRVLQEESKELASLAK